MVHEARDQRVRHQASGGLALVDHVGGDWLLHQRLATAAGPLAAQVHVHDELGRDHVQPLAHVLTDALHRLATRAGGLLRLVAVLDAPQVLGQLLAARLARRLGGRLRARLVLTLQRLQLRL